MSLERLKNAKKITIGTKQTMRALHNKEALVVYIAKNADPHVANPIIQLAAEEGVDTVLVDTLRDLGKACGIEIGSATASIIED